MHHFDHLRTWKYYPNPKPNPNPNLVSLHGTQAQNLIHPDPNHYSLYIYIPALAQIARIRAKPEPPPVTLNSAADVMQNAHPEPTWDFNG